MAQPPHFEIDGGIYFITTRLKQEGRFLIEREAEIVVNTVLDSSARKEITLYAYVIMPNYIHILIKPIMCGISKTMQLIKGRSSRQVTRGNFWQKEFFDFGILTEEKFREKFNYIHFNPVKWGLVEKAEDYKYSSALAYKMEYEEVFYNI
jgi:putative transposase